MTGSGYRSVAGRLSQTNSPPLHPNNKRNHHFLMYDKNWLTNSLHLHYNHKRNHHFLMYDRKWLLQRCWRAVPNKFSFSGVPQSQAQPPHPDV
jgi:hypothetical protein